MLNRNIDNITVVDKSTDEVIAVISEDEIVTLDGYEVILNVGVSE